MSKYPYCKSLELKDSSSQLDYELALFLEWFGARLRQYRNRMSYDQVDFAQLLGITQARLSQFENGAVDFKISTLLKIAAQLRLSIKTLVPSRSQLARMAYWRGGPLNL